MEKFAESLGLPGAPKIKFLNKELVKQRKNASRTVAAIQAEIEAEAKPREGSFDDENDSEEAATSSDDDGPATTVLTPDAEVKDNSKLSKVRVALHSFNPS